jgi:hypothetical protein
MTPMPPIRRPDQKPVMPESVDEELEEFESTIGSRRKKTPSRPEPRDEDFDEDELIEKKRSALPVVLLVLLLIIAGGAGVAIGYLKFFKTPQVAKPSTPASVEPAKTSSIPQLPVEQEIATPATPAPEPQAAAPVAQPPKPAVAPRREEPVRKPAPAPRVATRPKTPAKTAVAPSKPAPAPATSKPAGINQIVITSNPSGADVLINGKEMGQTPYTWENPFYGSVSISLAKAGYKESTKSIEFTGGNQKEFFALEKEAAAASYAPPPEYAKPEPTPAPAKPAPAKVAPSKPAPREEPVGDAGSFDDFEPTPAPVASRPAPAPAPSAPSSGASDLAGDPATIFIASIPPVADVYINGKLIGKTNISELKVVAGTHTMRFVKGGKEVTKDMTFQPGKNPSQMVRLQ